MIPLPRLLAIALVPLTLSACSGGTPCPGPRADWIAASSGKPAPAPANTDTIILDQHDRILWNGTITSHERLRDTLNMADAAGHTVRLTPQPGATCPMIEKVRVAMDRSLACGMGRCLESATGR